MSDVFSETEEEEDQFKKASSEQLQQPIRRSNYTSKFSSVTSSAGLFNDDEFNRLVRLGLGKNSSLMMRKDRRGIAITKG